MRTRARGDRDARAGDETDTEVTQTMMRRIMAAFAAALMATAAQAAPGTEKAVELDAGPTLKPMVFIPAEATTSPRAAVIVVHEWYGRNEFAQAKARELAEMGHVGIAWDMYGDATVTTVPAEAGKLAGALKGDRKEMRRRIAAAVDFARSLPGVDSQRIAAIGFCFGGTTVLELARSGADVRGVVSFHGGLDAGKDVATASPVTAKVLVLHGADDPMVPPAEVEAFTKEMKDAGADMRLVAYPGAVHSFTNPGAGNDNSKGAAYNAEADAKSREAMREFLGEVLKQP